MAPSSLTTSSVPTGISNAGATWDGNLTGAPTGIITVPHDRYRALASEVDVGPLHLRPGSTTLVEYLRSEPPDGRDVGWARGHIAVQRCNCPLADPSSQL